MRCYIFLRHLSIKKAKEGDDVMNLNVLQRLWPKKTNNELESEMSGQLVSDIKDIEMALDQDSIHNIYPFSWEIYPDHVQSGENFIRVIAITDYPLKVYGNWLSELRRKKSNINIVQHLEGSSSKIMIDYYKKTLSNKQAELLKIHDPVKIKQLKLEIESADLQLEKYLTNTTTFIYQHTYIYLRANSLKELDHLTESIKNTLIRLQFQYLVPIKGTFQAFWSTMPIGENLLKEYTYKESNSEAASSMLPFDNGEILNLNGYSEIKGINKDTGSLIAIDKTDRNHTLNPHEVIFGTSGIGKTTYMICQIFQNAIQGHKIYILDPTNAYSPIVKCLNGIVLDISSSTEYRINPLQFFTDRLLNNANGKVSIEELLKDKIQRVKGLLGVIKEDVSQVELAIMDGILREVYIKCGILKYKSIAEIKPEQYPILADVVNEMRAIKASKEETDRFQIIKDLYYILESYVRSDNSLFNGHTNVNLDNQIICFNLKPLQQEKEMQTAAYVNIFTYLSDEITLDRSEVKKIFADEFHYMTRHEQPATFFYQAYKTFRQFNASIISCTQQVQDVLQGHLVEGIPIGEAIVSNSYTKIFFGLDNMSVGKLTDMLKINFSEKEEKLLTKKKQGEAIIIYGSQRAFMKVELTSEELRIIAPAQYEEKYGLPACYQPDYEERIVITPREQSEIEQFLLEEEKQTPKEVEYGQAV